MGGFVRVMRDFQIGRLQVGLCVAVIAIIMDENREKRLRNAKLHKNWIKNQWQRFNGVVNPNFKLLAQVIIKCKEKAITMSVYRHQ